MKRILVIGHNDIRIFLGGIASYLWLFAVPFAFVYFMGLASRGPGEPANPRPAVLIENADHGFLSQILLDELGTQGMRLVGQDRREEADRGIRIPEDFTAAVQALKPVEVEFFKVGGSSDPAAARWNGQTVLAQQLAVELGLHPDW